MPVITSPTFLSFEFESLPSDAVQGVIPLTGLQMGDILLSICPKDGANPGVFTYFENIISADDELMQTGGCWGGATPTMVAVFIRG